MRKTFVTKDLEERLESLRMRDLEVASISMGIQMRSRISRLEEENEILRAALVACTEENDARLATLSWKITSPLRYLRRLINRKSK
jgi:hypothetical protein